MLQYIIQVDYSNARTSGNNNKYTLQFRVVTPLHVQYIECEGSETGQEAHGYQTAKPDARLLEAEAPLQMA